MLAKEYAFRVAVGRRMYILDVTVSQRKVSSLGGNAIIVNERKFHFLIQK